MADQFQVHYGTQYPQQGQQPLQFQPMPYAQPSQSTSFAHPMPYPQPGTPSVANRQPVAPYPQPSMPYQQVAPHPYQSYPPMPQAQTPTATAASPQYYHPSYPMVGLPASPVERPLPSPVPSPTPSQRSFIAGSPISVASTPSAPQQYPVSASPMASPLVSPQPVRRAPQVYSSSPQLIPSSPQLTSVSQVNLTSSLPSLPPSPQIYQAHPASSLATPAYPQPPSSPFLGPAPLYESSKSPAALAATMSEKGTSIPFNASPPPYIPPTSVASQASSSSTSPTVSLARVGTLHATAATASSSPASNARGGNSGASIASMSTQAFYEKIVPRVLPTLPSIPDWKPATGTTDKVLRLDPLPYGWTPENLEGDYYFGSDPPRNGCQNVVWRHAMPALTCDGCQQPQAFDHRIRYTCSTCHAGTFDLCEACFTTKDVASLHNPNHELYRMDVAHPDWSHPCWNAGVMNLGESVSQVGSRTLHWDKDDYKKGDQWAELYAKRQSDPPMRDYEIVEWNGMAMSIEGMLVMLYAIQDHVVEINFRSNPELPGLMLILLLEDFLSRYPYAFPKLKVVRAIGCGFFDWRTKLQAKITSVEQQLNKIFEDDRQKLLKKNGQPATTTRPFVVSRRKQKSSSGFLGGMFKKKDKDKNAGNMTDNEGNVVIRGKVRVQLGVCDGSLTTPCGFPGLPAGMWTGREPRLCYHMARDVMLEMIEYLGCPDRVADPIQERTRVLNKRKRERYAKLCELIGMKNLSPAQQQAANVLLNQTLDQTVASY